MLPSVLRRLVRCKHVRYVYFSPRQMIVPIKWIDNILLVQKPLNQWSIQQFCTQDNNNLRELSRNEFEHICEETLESLCEHLELLLESSYTEIKGCDVSFGDGVLTLMLGINGTYVINRQTPNKQIWLSSPKSGPKRYDFDINLNTWIYKHDNVSLHTLLQEELSIIFKKNVDLTNCSYCILNKS